MKNILTFILRSQLQNNKQVKSQNGFTLIELLVAMVIAFLVITPLMGFMIDILNTDRREQAKTTSEQEIQSALDYIARDMEQAIYIYDADGINGRATPTPAITGIKNQIPSGTDRVPVLVFWKRTLLNQDQTVKVSGSDIALGCLVKLPGGSTCSAGNKQDYVVYSLVAYYLLNNSGSSTWNPTTTRIARWEIRDGIRDLNGSETRTEGSASVKYLFLPDKGFMQFDISSAGNLRTKLGNWTKHSEAYDFTVNKLDTLVDFIDQTTSGSPAPVCNSDEQQVPDYSAAGVPDSLKTGSFYVCVNSDKYIARVHIRGNALARITPDAEYSSQQATYFPTSSIQINARGFLGIE